MFEWVKNESRNPNATLYSTNITLNRSAVELLEDPGYVMLGIDKPSMKIAIRPVSQHEICDGLIAKEEMFKISVGRSYARIANRSFCNMINELFNLGLTAEQGRKFPLCYDPNAQVLVIEIAKGEIE